MYSNLSVFPFMIYSTSSKLKLLSFTNLINIPFPLLLVFLSFFFFFLFFFVFNSLTQVVEVIFVYSVNYDSNLDSSSNYYIILLV